MAEFPHTTGYLLLLSAAVTLGMQMSFFCIAYLCQFDKVTDFAGASNFLLLAWLTYAIGTEDSDFNTRKFVITICITLWSVRLGSYLLYRVLQRGSDQRFDDLRGKFFSFLGFWILQFVWVFVVSLPVITVNGSTENVDLGARDYIGWALFVIGFIIESWADNSKSIFVANREKKGENQGIKQGLNAQDEIKIITYGPWSISRHPNYFGEIIIWLGIFLSSCSVYEANHMLWAYVSVISPVITFVLLIFVSGIPGAEERYNKKYGKNQWYLDYRNRTSPLIPLPASIYQSLPEYVQKYIFFEYDIYKVGLEEEKNHVKSQTAEA